MTDGREHLSWELFGTATRELAEQIAADGYQPDIILSVARGGLFVAGALGYALDVKNLHVANVEFYTGVDERLPVPITFTERERGASKMSSGIVVEAFWRVACWGAGRFLHRSPRHDDAKSGGPVRA